MAQPGAKEHTAKVSRALCSTSEKKAVLALQASIRHSRTPAKVQALAKAQAVYEAMLAASGKRAPKRVKRNETA